MPEGTHTFGWTYEKDWYGSGGSDCAWLDYIVLPTPENPVPPSVEFSADKTRIQPGEEIQVTDLLTNEQTSWDWEFEGGSPSSSNQQNPLTDYYTLTQVCSPDNQFEKG